MLHRVRHGLTGDPEDRRLDRRCEPLAVAADDEAEVGLPGVHDAPH